MPSVTFINSNGGGFQGSETCNPGETIEQFLTRKGITNFSDYNIRLNGQEVRGDQRLVSGDRVSAVVIPGTVSANQQLQDGQRLTVTPKRIAGAVA